MAWDRCSRGDARFECSSSSVPRICELVVLDRDPRLLDFFLGKRLAEEFARQFREQRAGDDVVNHSPAGIRVVATRHNVLYDRVIVAEGRVMIVTEASSD